MATIETKINDISLEPTADGIFDIVLQGADFKQAIDLQTAIVISLFSDGRSEIDDATPLSRGWAGDSLNQDQESLTGSRIWLLRNGKLTNQTLTDLEDFAIKATQWIIDNKIATEITATASFLNKAEGRVSLHLAVTEPQGNIEREYVFSWDQIKQDFRGI